MRHAVVAVLWALLAATQAAVAAAWLGGAAVPPAFLSPDRASDVALAAFLLVTFPLQAVVAGALASGRPWARPAAFAAAVPGVLVYPVGTILCSAAVLQLLQPESASA